MNATAMVGLTPRRGNALRSEASADPINAPSRPPATPATIAQMRPSGISDDGHGSGIQMWLQSHSAAKPTVPIARPHQAPKRIGLRVEIRYAMPSPRGPPGMGGGE